MNTRTSRWLVLFLTTSLVGACSSGADTAGTTTTPSQSESTTTSVVTPDPTTTAPATDPQADGTPWPTAGWDTSTPEEQGIDSDLLAEMLEQIENLDYEIDSVTVVRNGYLVLDAAFYPFPSDIGHIIHSCTKSVTSSLIGIAIGDGLIGGVDQLVTELLPAVMPAAPEPGKAAMTLEDLLTMRSGLDCRDSYLYNWEGLREMRSGSDWAAHMLALPMSEEPGTRFEYCNGASYLLSAVITEVTGLSALQYGDDVLFDPLGIDNISWPFSPQGINHGWGDMVLHPHDMAKFAYLFLNDGVWDGERILPEGWVEMATTPHVDAGTLAANYGYQWWIQDDVFMALGFGGQYILVSPDLDLVAVFTSGLPGNEFNVPGTLFRRYIVGAVSGQDILPANPEGTARIETHVAAAANGPEPAIPGPLPAMASEVSGQRYMLEPNSGDFMWIQVDFDGSDEARLQLEDRDGPIDVAVGLDGVERVSPTWGRSWSFVGEWTDDHTFSIDWIVIGGAIRGTMDLGFDGDTVDFRFVMDTTGRIDEAIGTRDAG